MFQVIGERFSCEQVTVEEDNLVFGMIKAEEMSNEHDMDFVVLLNEGLPVGKWIDGKRQ